MYFLVFMLETVASYVQEVTTVWIYIPKYILSQCRAVGIKRDNYVFNALMVQAPHSDTPNSSFYSWFLCQEKLRRILWTFVAWPASSVMPNNTIFLHDTAVVIWNQFKFLLFLVVHVYCFLLNFIGGNHCLVASVVRRWTITLSVEQVKPRFICLSA